MAIVTMESGRRFRLHLSSDAGIEVATSAAQKHGAAKDDRVVDIIFEDAPEEAEGEVKEFLLHPGLKRL